MTTALSPLILYKGESRAFTFTVTDPNNGNAVVNLGTQNGGLSAIDFKIKPAVGVSPVLAKSIGSGIVVATQSGLTLGQFTVTLGATDLAAVTAGGYIYDLAATFLDATVSYLIKPTPAIVYDV